MAAVLTTLAVSYSITRHLPTMPLVTAVFVLVFGGLTLIPAGREFREDEGDHALRSVRLRRCSAALWFDKLLLSAVFDRFSAGRRRLAQAHRALGVFLLCLAVLNEFVRRSVTTDVWVNFKVFGLCR